MLTRGGVLGAVVALGTAVGAGPLVRVGLGTSVRVGVAVGGSVGVTVGVFVGLIVGVFVGGTGVAVEVDVEVGGIAVGTSVAGIETAVG